MIFAGIDVGSLTSKCVLLDSRGQIIGSSIGLVGSQSRKAGERVFQEAMDMAGLKTEDVSYIVSTGYGRAIVPISNEQVTELSCHARGAHFLCPQVRTVIDIG